MRSEATCSLEKAFIGASARKGTVAWASRGLAPLSGVSEFQTLAG
jgi:hypothetical protein